MKHPVICSALLVLTALLLATCAPALSTEGPSTWIDKPLDEAKLPLEPTEIMAHASDSDGVSWFDIYVNGVLLAHAQAVASAPVQLYSTGYSGAPGTAGYLASTTVGWDPKAAGVYTIMAMATDSKGNPGPYTQAVVTVGTVQAPPVPSPAVPPVVEIVPQGTPSPQLPSPATSTPTPTATATHTHGPVITPTPTRTPTPTATATTQAPAKRAEIIYFQANPGTINKGECSTLSWDVQYAAAAYLDGQGVTAPNTQQVCPATTTTYTLYAQSAGGDDQETAIVTVIEAPTPTSTPHELTADVAMTDLYPETPNGPVYGRLTNNGPDTLTNVTVQYQCLWDEIDRIEGVIHYSGQVGPTPMTVTSLSPGQTTPFNVDIPVNVTAYEYDINCRIFVGFNDPDPANNAYYEEF